jgi:hypothetical protein
MTDRCPLRLLAQGLSDADLAKVSAFMRLGRDHLRGDWSLVFDGDAHVMMIGYDEPVTVAGLLENPLLMLNVVDGDSPLGEAPGVLPRPLQYESVIEALSSAESRLVRAAVQGAPAPAPAAPLPVAGSVEALAGLPAKTLYRLRRWPPAAVLQGHRYHLRLASFLSPRPLAIDALARLSNVEQEACATFIARLHEHGLVEVMAPVVTPLAPSPAPAAPAPVKTGLLGRIRQRLGITWAR